MKNRVGLPAALSCVLLVPVIVAGLASILATSVPTALTATSSANYLYANWDCKNQSQCIAVIGHNLGSAGPFCSRAPCDQWRQTYFSGATCDASAKNTIWAKAPSPCQG